MSKYRLEVELLEKEDTVEKIEYIKKEDFDEILDEIERKVDECVELLKTIAIGTLDNANDALGILEDLSDKLF